MPTYEYLCLTCEVKATESRAIEDRDEPVYCFCGNTMTRTFNAPGITFNGPGFYKTGG